MIYYGIILVIAVAFLDATDNSALSFGLAMALFLLKLIVLGPEDDPNG